jgi:hypothetical protein
MEGADLKEDLMSIEARCKRCRGTGRVSLSRPDLPIESGVFCDDCETGRQRWKEVSKLIEQAETARGSTVFTAKHRPRPTS